VALAAVLLVPAGAHARTPCPSEDAAPTAMNQAQVSDAIVCLTNQVQPPRGGCPGSVSVGALRAPRAKLVTTTRRATTIASLSALSLSPRRFRTGGRGTLVSYVLSGSALVSFGAERGLSSRSVGGRCRAPTRSNRRAKPCVRYRTLAETFTDEGEAGRNTFRFIGHLGGSKLKPGRYRLRGVATLASASDRLRPATQGRFEIVRR